MCLTRNFIDFLLYLFVGHHDSAEGERKTANDEDEDDDDLVEFHEKVDKENIAQT